MISDRTLLGFETLLSLACLVACAAPGARPSNERWPDGRWVDLTHPFDAQTVYWPTAEPFELVIESRGRTDAGFWYEANRFCTAEHGGTHLDAPVHFAQGRRAVDAIPLESLIGPAAVVDVSERAGREPDYEVSTADLRAWEDAHGELPDGAILLLRTGHARFWPDPERYLGTAERGAAALEHLHFPGLHPDAARWLVEERSVAAVGLDSPSIDHGPARLFETHRVLSEDEIPVLENLAELDELPATGATVFALPMKIAGGSGAPLRAVALVPR